MKSPLVSIVIPTHNIANLPKNILESTLSQTHRNLEIIIINDGSTDQTQQILENQKDPRITLIHQKNQGPAAARNTGIKKATGQYLMFFDADDEVHPKMVEEMLASIQKTKSDLVTCAFRYHRLAQKATSDIFTAPVPPQHKNEPLKAYIIRLLGNDGRLHSLVNKIFRTEIIQKNHIRLDPTLDFGEDLTFVLEYLSRAQKISFLQRPLYTYHFGTHTSTVANTSLKIHNWQKNWQYLTTWFTPENQTQTDQLNWICYRWAYSLILAIHRSKKTKRQKQIYYKATQKAANSLPPLGKIQNIGRTKYLQEKAYRLASKTPHALPLFAATITKIKSTIIL